MTLQLWSDVDSFIEQQLIERDPALELAVADSAAAGLPPIAVTAPMGKMLFLLAKIHGAKRILEAGTHGGYSTIWLARSLPPGGAMVTLELSAHSAAVADANIARAGLSDIVRIRVGAALDSMDQMIAERCPAFDLIFLDADKSATPEYLERSLKLTRPGSVIISDNSVRAGEVANAQSADEGARGMRRMHEMLAAEPAVAATTIQTVGAKGHDGFTLMLVGDRPGG